MKIALVLVMVCLAVVAVSANEQEKYSTKFDHIDPEDILKSDRLLINYFKCLMGTGSCTAAGEALKNHIADALENNCKLCSDKQKEGARKVIEFLRKFKPDLWNTLKAKYDPEGKYEAQYPKPE